MSAGRGARPTRSAPPAGSQRGTRSPGPLGVPQHRGSPRGHPIGHQESGGSPQLLRTRPGTPGHCLLSPSVDLPAPGQVPVGGESGDVGHRAVTTRGQSGLTRGSGGGDPELGAVPDTHLPAGPPAPSLFLCRLHTLLPEPTQPRPLGPGDSQALGRQGQDAEFRCRVVHVQSETHVAP